MSNHNDRPFDRIHRELVDLLFRQNLFHQDNVDSLSEDVLAEAIGLAVSLADPDEQLRIVSRIMTDEEIALQGLRHPDMRNVNIRIALTAGERAAVLRVSRPLEPEDDPAAPADLGECLICTEDAHLTVPCGCLYCLQCLREAICVGLRSEESFPPRCCAPFAEATVRLGRSPVLVHLYRMMQAEAATPVPDRLYCYDGRCATFIPRPTRDDYQTHARECPACGRRTCQNCARRGHEADPWCGEGDEVVEDVVEDVWATMDRNAAVNCPGCGRMISLQDGCNHMTCVCGTQFCYICGWPWRTCHCPSYRGYHLMVPVRDRPGLKPEPLRLYRRGEPGRAAELEEARTIPQLRPQRGERPLAWDIPRRRMPEPGEMTGCQQPQEVVAEPTETHWGDVGDAVDDIERHVLYERGSGPRVGVDMTLEQGQDAENRQNHTRQPSPDNDLQGTDHRENTIGGAVEAMPEAEQELRLAGRIRRIAQALEDGWARGRPARVLLLTAISRVLELLEEQERRERRHGRRRRARRRG